MGGKVHRQVIFHRKKQSQKEKRYSLSFTFDNLITYIIYFHFTSDLSTTEVRKIYGRTSTPSNPLCHIFDLLLNKVTP